MRIPERGWEGKCQTCHRLTADGTIHIITAGQTSIRLCDTCLGDQGYGLVSRRSIRDKANRAARRKINQATE